MKIFRQRQFTGIIEFLLKIDHVRKNDRSLVLQLDRETKQKGSIILYHIMISIYEMLS